MTLLETVIRHLTGPDARGGVRVVTSDGETCELRLTYIRNGHAGMGIEDSIGITLDDLAVIADAVKVEWPFTYPEEDTPVPEPSKAHRTALGCSIRVYPSEVGDQAGLMLSLSMDDGRHAEVLLAAADRAWIRDAWGVAPETSPDPECMTGPQARQRANQMLRAAFTEGDDAPSRDVRRDMVVAAQTMATLALVEATR